MPTEKGWAIAGQFGLYVGWWTTRKQAIEDHVLNKVGSYSRDEKELREKWEACKRTGDRAVKVSIKYQSK